MFFPRRHTDRQKTHEKMLSTTNHQGNANQNHNEVSLHTCQNGYYQKDNKEVWTRMWRKRNLRGLLLGLEIGTATMENSMEIPQKIKNRTNIKTINSTSWNFSKENKNIIQKIYMHPYVHVSIIYNSQDMEITQVPIRAPRYNVYIQWNITQLKK